MSNYVVWESWVWQGQWKPLSATVSRKMETIFTTNGASTSLIAGLMFDPDKMEYPANNPVRRAKMDSGVTCQYHDGYAWCAQNSYISTLIIDAKAAGRQTTRFYLADKTPYDVCLVEPCTQTNVVTGTNRALYIPALPVVMDDDDDDDDDSDDGDEVDQELVDKMPEDLVGVITCPISHQVMRKPVIDRFGHIYEKAAIIRWLSSKNKSPMTGKEMLDQTLVPVHSLKKFIASLKMLKYDEAEETGGSGPSGAKRKAPVAPPPKAKKMKAITPMRLAS